jgi:hypothetical protein
MIIYIRNAFWKLQGIINLVLLHEHHWAAVLLLMGAQVGAALFPSGLFTHFLARCPFQLSSVCPRVCELLTAVEVINQLMSKTN